MNHRELIGQIKVKRSYLCIGLDTDIARLPLFLGNSTHAVLEFNRAIIDATKDLAVAYKINTAFYEQYGPVGWELMAETLRYIPDNIFTIADAKRGDIGNTSKKYASAFFEEMNFDAITVSPYMGSDSVQPFLYEGKTVIVLGLTSNPGSADFQMLEVNGKPLYKHVIAEAARWGTAEQIMFVVGATKANMLREIREIVPNHFLLVPGVGAQGGNLKEVTEAGQNRFCGLLVNSSRDIIYASSREDFARASRASALKVQQEMHELLKI